MFPIICQIGPFALYSYGLMLAIAVIICSILLARDAKALNISSNQIHDLVFWVVIWGILGARVFYILVHLEFFINDPREIMMIQHGGLSWQGSLIAGSLTGFIFIKRWKWPFWVMLDLIAPYIALGQAIGRIGCFLNGCCYGHPAEWGIYFPNHGEKLIPTQLFDMVGLGIVFFILKKLQRLEHLPGKIFVYYLIFASSLRFVIEFFRADHDLLWGNLSIYQYVCLAVLGAALYVNAFFLRSSR